MYMKETVGERSVGKRQRGAPNTSSFLQTTSQSSALCSLSLRNRANLSVLSKAESRCLVTRVGEALASDVFRRKTRSSHRNLSATYFSPVGTHRQSGVGVVAQWKIFHDGVQTLREGRSDGRRPATGSAIPMCRASGGWESFRLQHCLTYDDCRRVPSSCLATSVQ